MAFLPSSQWLNNQPWKSSTLIRVRAEIYGGWRARHVVQDFMDSLSYQSGDGVACEGGYCLKLTSQPRNEITEVEFSSSGEDGYSSVLYGVEDFEKFVAGTSDITGVRWVELEPQRCD